MKKIVFILNGIYKSRCIKRIEEFIDNGFDVDVYGFAWDNGLVNKSNRFDITVIGKQSNSYSYLKRIGIIIKALRPLYRKYRHQDVCFYYFFIDVALGAFFLSKAPYFYEESDIPYLNLKNSFIKRTLALLDKKIIKNSLLTVVTSEGFIEYHFGDKKPNNIVLVPNRLNPRIVDYPYIPKVLDIDHLSIGFVGGVRYKSILSFAEVFVSRYPGCCFHVFGDIEPQYMEGCNALAKKYQNFILHGIFRNPEDLSGIYSQIDLVLATYDVSSGNVKYAEPNKLYEAIYFGTPIIVSKGTFLSEKVKNLCVGYSVDALDPESITGFINSLTKEDVLLKKEYCHQFPQSYVLNSNPELFAKLKTII